MFWKIRFWGISMIDIQQLLSEKEHGEYNDLRRKTGLTISQLSQFKHGKSMRTSTAINLLKALGQDVPCELDEVNKYMRKLWDESEHVSIHDVAPRLGVAASSLSRWIYWRREQDLSYPFFLMFCKYMNVDDNINKFTFGGF